MGFLLPKRRGKARRRYETLRASRCDEIWTMDTTYWPAEWWWDVDLPSHGCEERLGALCEAMPLVEWDLFRRVLYEPF